MPLHTDLRLIASTPEPLAGVCRVIGCSQPLTDPLGFCHGCRVAYDRRRAHAAARVRLALDVVRATHPGLFGALDKLRPGLGEALADHLAGPAAHEPGAPTLSLQALDDFLAETQQPETWR